MFGSWGAVVRHLRNHHGCKYGSIPVWLVDKHEYEKDELRSQRKFNRDLAKLPDEMHEDEKALVAPASNGNKMMFHCLGCGWDFTKINCRRHFCKMHDKSSDEIRKWIVVQDGDLIHNGNAAHAKLEKFFEWTDDDQAGIGADGHADAQVQVYDDSGNAEKYALFPAFSPLDVSCLLCDECTPIPKLNIVMHLCEVHGYSPQDLLEWKAVGDAQKIVLGMPPETFKFEGLYSDCDWGAAGSDGDAAAVPPAVAQPPDFADAVTDPPAVDQHALGAVYNATMAAPPADLAPPRAHPSASPAAAPANVK
jgi:hypothetical protein